jgi:hypothetical protein
VVNDIDENLTNFWRVIRDEELFPRFHRQVKAVNFSEVEWDAAADRLSDSDPVLRAVAFFIRCRQSLAGRMDTFARLSRTRTRRGSGGAIVPHQRRVTRSSTFNRGLMTRTPTCAHEPESPLSRK